MVVSKNSGTPKWMVFFMENPINMGRFGGSFPTILGNIQMRSVFLHHDFLHGCL